MSWFGKAKQSLAHEEKELSFARQEGDEPRKIRSILNILNIKKRIKQEEINSSKQGNQ